MMTGKRITPAYTGNTAWIALIVVFAEDHPRIHGEHSPLRWRNNRIIGSPPHTRGTRKVLVGRLAILRITPAYTGNTEKLDYDYTRYEDHPRIHGEHNSSISYTSPTRGSPPHTRGTRFEFSDAPNVRRITPAYTGNTKISNTASQCIKDHPRIHGEH